MTTIEDRGITANWREDFERNKELSDSYVCIFCTDMDLIAKIHDPRRIPDTSNVEEF